MPWATSASSGALMSVRLPGWRMPPHQRRPVASAGWCHDRRLFRGRYGIYRQPRRGDLGASVLVRAGCGEGECGGARLVGSEKSPIVTLRWCVGLGGLIENVLSRRGLRSPTELSGGASVICGNAQSSARIAVPVCGWDAPPDAAGTVRHPVAARAPRGKWLALCSHGRPVSQVTVGSGNGLRPTKVEPVRLKVVCSQVDRA